MTCENWETETDRFVYKLGRLNRKVGGLFEDKLIFCKLLKKRSFKNFKTRTQNSTPSFQTRLTLLKATSGKESKYNLHTLPNC